MFKKLFSMAIDSKTQHEFCEKIFKSGLFMKDAIDYLAKEGFNSIEEFYNYCKTIIKEEVNS